MFDSLLIEIDNREVELQSKRFDCALNSYRLGDVVDAAPTGICAFFDTIRLDADGRRVYGSEQANEGADVIDCTLFLVLAHAVFTDYVVVKGAMRTESIEDRIAELRETWGDSGRLLSRWVDFLRDRQAANNRYRHRLDSALSVLDRALDLREGKPLPERLLGIFDQPLVRLKEGEDPLGILRDVLSAESEPFSWTAEHGPAPHPLEQYRL
ncbi:MAG: hypothetical protein KJ558_11115 [Gammaproteobacteria bacterium]|nr:hypothetical protein [Gammaproteobacteria bacterium]MBU1655356.1 hypothetical protein [Gammaproteobacteria bacterium]MBU1960539.1 hypothetical protein [Gammaproteobacteria bacterium]